MLALKKMRKVKEGFSPMPTPSPTAAERAAAAAAAAAATANTAPFPSDAINNCSKYDITNPNAGTCSNNKLSNMNEWECTWTENPDLTSFSGTAVRNAVAATLNNLGISVGSIYSIGTLCSNEESPWWCLDNNQFLFAEKCYTCNAGFEVIPGFQNIQGGGCRECGPGTYAAAGAASCSHV